jgi:hypothetical protein
MRIVRIALAWALACAVAGSVGAATSASAAAGRRSSSQVRTEVRMDVRGRVPRRSTAGYRTSLQRLSTTSRPIAVGPSEASTTPRPPEPSTPSSVQTFAGIPQADPFEPSDTTGALGDTYFLTAVNTEYALWNTDGSPAIGPTSLDTLMNADDGLDLFDPKVVYDAYRNTFVLVYLAQRDSPRRSLILVVTIPDATATDQTTWCKTAILGDQVSSDARTWADYPGLGFDAKRVTIATNAFTFPTSSARFAGAQVLSFPKSKLYDCSVELTGKVFAGSKTENADGSRAFTIQPAQSVGPAPSQYLLSFEQNGRRSAITVFRIKKTSKVLRISHASLRTGRVAPAPPGTQGGGSEINPDTWWDTGDTRLINAYYDGDLNRVYGAHAVARNLQPDPVTGGYQESVVRWYEADPSGKPKRWNLTRSGVVGAPETDAGWGMVATDASGNLFVTFSRGSEPLGEFLSAWAAEIQPGSRTATLAELVPGTAKHDAISGIERWGDYTGIDRDPIDPNRVAMINQIAVPSSVCGTTSGGCWQQTVNVVTHA